MMSSCHLLLWEVLEAMLLLPDLRKVGDQLSSLVLRPSHLKIREDMCMYKLALAAENLKS